nr:MAG TPA: hypothetical protein [Caudoviricetes sp.]
MNLNALKRHQSAPAGRFCFGQRCRMLEPLDESATVLHGFGKLFLHSYKWGKSAKVSRKVRQSVP